MGSSLRDKKRNKKMISKFIDEYAEEASGDDDDADDDEAELPGANSKQYENQYYRSEELERRQGGLDRGRIKSIEEKYKKQLEEREAAGDADNLEDELEDDLG